MFSLFSTLNFILLSIITDDLILFSFKVCLILLISLLLFDYSMLHIEIVIPFSHLCRRLKINLSGSFPWDLPLVIISPEWVTGPEQGKSSGRIATFSLCTGKFRDGFSSIFDETVIPLWLGRHLLLCENRVYHEKVRMIVG